MKERDVFIMMAAALMGMGGTDKAYHDDARVKFPRVACKDCYFYTGGTYCKRAKHHVNKSTPAGGCAYFRKK